METIKTTNVTNTASHTGKNSSQTVATDGNSSKEHENTADNVLLKVKESCKVFDKTYNDNLARLILYTLLTCKNTKINLTDDDTIDIIAINLPQDEIELDQDITSELQKITSFNNLKSIPSIDSSDYNVVYPTISKINMMSNDSFAEQFHAFRLAFYKYKFSHSSADTSTNIASPAINNTGNTTSVAQQDSQTTVQEIQQPATEQPTPTNKFNLDDVLQKVKQSCEVFNKPYYRESAILTLAYYLQKNNSNSLLDDDVIDAIAITSQYAIYNGPSDGLQTSNLMLNVLKKLGKDVTITQSQYIDQPELIHAYRIAFYKKRNDQQATADTTNVVNNKAQHVNQEPLDKTTYSTNPHNSDEKSTHTVNAVQKWIKMWCKDTATQNKVNEELQRDPSPIVTPNGNVSIQLLREYIKGLNSSEHSQKPSQDQPNDQGPRMSSSDVITDSLGYPAIMVNNKYIQLLSNTSKNKIDYHAMNAYNLVTESIRNYFKSGLLYDIKTQFKTMNIIKAIRDPEKLDEKQLQPIVVSYSSYYSRSRTYSLYVTKNDETARIPTAFIDRNYEPSQSGSSTSRIMLVPKENIKFRIHALGKNVLNSPSTSSSGGSFIDRIRSFVDRYNPRQTPRYAEESRTNLEEPVIAYTDSYDHDNPVALIIPAIGYRTLFT